MTRRLLGVALVAIVVAAGRDWRSPGLVVAAQAVTFIGAGDIANCDHLDGARATARLIEGVAGTVFTLGDHVYPTASAKAFHDCYATTWGRFRARTRPTLGNHDIFKNDVRAYFDYFGEQAGPRDRGYYSYELGAWHIIALNSNAPVGGRSPQVRWLRDDLAAHPTDCILAYWHIPRFSSGTHGGDVTMEDLWRPLMEFGADVVLNGHAHGYERFAPQTDKGKADPEHGIRQFVVGTGGGEPDKFARVAANSEVRESGAFGVLKLTLSPGAYQWEFLPVEGETFHDAGSGVCSPVH